MKQFLGCLISVSLVVFGLSVAQAAPTPFKALQGPKVVKVGVSSATYVKPDPPPPVRAIRQPGDCNKWRSVIAQYDWNVDVAVNVCNAESGGDPNNDNPNDRHPSYGLLVCYGSRGLFQIGCDSTSNYAGMFNPYTNIAEAYAKYKARGWSPWGYTTCRYKVVCY